MNFFWAGVYSCYKIIGEQMPTGGIVTLRFGLAGLCLLAVWPWLPGRAPRGRDLVVTCLGGVILCVLGQRLQVGGNQLGTAGNSAVLMAVEPLITSVAAALFLHEHIGPRRLGGFALGLFGVVLLNRAWRPDFPWVVRLRGGLLGAGQTNYRTGQCDEDAGPVTAFRNGGEPADRWEEHASACAGPNACELGLASRNGGDLHGGRL